MHDAREVKQRLLGNLESVCSYLLPAGKTIGHEYRVGDINGSPGKSLAINLRGEQAGVWIDFASPEHKGDVLDLWCQAKNLSFKEAFPEICRWLGITPIERPKPVQKPKVDFKVDVSGMRGTPVYDYLQGRGIGPETMQLYKVRTHKRPSEFNTDFIAFQFWDSDGDPVMLKSTGIALKPEGNKDIWTSKPFYTLWGWWLIKESDRALIITEGEIDAMSLHQLSPGMPVLSMPSGASNLTWIENDYHALLRFERIYICTDMDPTGVKAAEEIAKRLGLTRCFRLPVPLPFKDANHALTKGEEHHLEVSRWFEAATTYDPPTLRTAGSYLDAMKRRLNRWQEEEEKPGFFLPGVHFAFRKSECTLLCGVKGHGKSDMLYQSFDNEMRNGTKVCIASFEIDPDEMLIVMVQQRIGHRPTASECEKALSWYDGRLWFFHPKEDYTKGNPSVIFDDFKYAAQRFGCGLFAIDSLIFVCKKDDYEGQDLFAKRIRDFDRAHDTHTVLIAHASPKKDENAVPRKSDISGSGGIITPFSNVLIVWRNVSKEEAIEKATQDGNTPEVEKLSKSHDAVLFITDQRYNGKRSKTKLFFDQTSRTFRTTPDLPPKPSFSELF